MTTVRLMFGFGLPREDILHVWVRSGSGSHSMFGLGFAAEVIPCLD